MEKYYEEGFLKQVNIFDSYSTDGSREELEKYDFINIQTYGENDLNDQTIQDIKDSCWKNSDADFVYVCDFDEILWSPNLKEELELMLKENITICKPRIYQLLSNEFPTYDKEIIKSCRFNYDPDFGKTGLFSPKDITEINYNAGAHKCDPKGNVKWYSGNKIFVFHANFLSKEYVLNKYRKRNERLSEFNRKNHLSYQYSWTDERIFGEFNDKMKNSVEKIEDLL